jgi:tRNA (guanine37-N1)-methyltransferase
MLPGVVGKYESVATDSFYIEARLGAPQYTRPPLFRGLGVPDVLLSGDHARIEEFRAREAWKKTAKNRPLLLGLREKGADADG